MVEYHGWITLRDSTVETDESRLARIAAFVQKEIEPKNTQHRLLGMKVVNGNYFLYFAGCANHRSLEVDETFDLIRHIANKAPGSYGLLYIWDDEDAKNENAFRVWKLAKGILSEEADPFLSPCLPTIEDFE
jgi:Immunity protein 7